MRLQTIRIENFKGLQEAEFSPTDFGCLVGENNAGKSSALQAIVFALNRPSQIPSSLFYDTAVPIRFVLTFSGVTEPHLARLATEHRERITPLVINTTLTLFIRYRVNEKVETGVLRLTPIEPRYRTEAIDAAFAGKRGTALRDSLEEHYPEFLANAPQNLTVGAFKAHVSAAVAALPQNQFQMAEGPLPSGIATSISSLLPEAIYIPAVKNLADDLKTTQSTSFGRLLSLLLEDMTPDLAAITQSLGALNVLFNRVVEGGAEVDRRHPKVRALESPRVF